MSSVNTVEVTEMVIENVALSYLVDIKKQFLEAHKRKERALLSESAFEFNKFYVSVDTLLAMIKSKTIKSDNVKKVDDILKQLEELKTSEENIKTKIKKLKEILTEVGQIIREQGWFDMPRRQERKFDIISEFYGVDAHAEASK